MGSGSEWGGDRRLTAATWPREHSLAEPAEADGGAIVAEDAEDLPDSLTLWALCPLREMSGRDLVVARNRLTARTGVTYTIRRSERGPDTCNQNR